VTANGATYTVKARRGVVSSSDLFGVTQQRIDQLRGLFHTDIMEMESAPLGHVCETLGVPYLIVRAGKQCGPGKRQTTDYYGLGPIAAREAAKFSLAFAGLSLSSRYPHKSRSRGNVLVISAHQDGYPEDGQRPGLVPSDGISATQIGCPPATRFNQTSKNQHHGSTAERIRRAESCLAELLQRLTPSIPWRVSRWLNC